MVMSSSTVDFATPFEVDTLLEIRTSSMKKMGDLDIMTGIDKKPHDGPIKITKLGLEGDEHDLTFHGGPDKAILSYCSSHYPNWQSSYPDRSEKFVPGGFGENFVTARMNERNVCIGDVMSVGPEALLQVSLPRQPCFKLNHRFSLKNFAPVTYKTSRTGWYYRVLREGTVKVGDELRLVERKWPRWTVERVQEYLHRNTENQEMNELLSQIEELGGEAKNQFKRRVDKAKRRAQAKNDIWTEYRVISRSMETPRVVSLGFESVNLTDTSGLDKLPGRHVRLTLPNGLVRPYSVVREDISDKRHTFELGVALDDNSRGGSRYIHDNVQVGDIIKAGNMTTGVPMAAAASKHIFIAGGIGITAFLTMLRSYHDINWDFHLHYGVRSSEDAPFLGQLKTFGDKVTLYEKSLGKRMDIDNIVKTMPWNSHLYVCGSDRMTTAVQRACAEHNFPQDEVHYEAFGANKSGKPFEVRVANRTGGRVLKVSREESLLEVLKREFGDQQVSSSCEVGNCGTCRVAVREGVVEHRGTALLEGEKGEAMLSCVSRGVGCLTIEI